MDPSQRSVAKEIHHAIVRLEELSERESIILEMCYLLKFEAINVSGRRLPCRLAMNCHRVMQFNVYSFVRESSCKARQVRKGACLRAKERDGVCWDLLVP